jgi:hypothetical protein
MSAQLEYLKYEYRLVTGEVSIDTSAFVKDISEITKIIISKNDNLMETLSIYPRGFIIYFNQSSSDILVKTNYPLHQREDGKYEIMFDKK